MGKRRHRAKTGPAKTRGVAKTRGQAQTLPEDRFVKNRRVGKAVWQALALPGHRCSEDTCARRQFPKTGPAETVTS